MRRKSHINSQTTNWNTKTQNNNDYNVFNYVIHFIYMYRRRDSAGDDDIQVNDAPLPLNT